MRALRWIGYVVLSVVCWQGSGFAEDAGSFRFSRPIQSETPSQEELFAVPLDSSVYAETRDRFPDLRVLDQENRLVPFLIRRVSTSRSEKARKWWTVARPELKPLNNNAMEIRIVVKAEEPLPLGINFVTPLQNFEQQVQVFSIINGTETLLVDGALIFDYSQFMDVRRTEVPLPATTAREFRIVIDVLTSDQESALLELTRSLRGDAEEGRTEKTVIQRRPFRIDRIDLWSEQSGQADIVHRWPATDLKVSLDSEHKQTLVEFTSRREPLTELKIVSSSRNFSRHAAIQIEADSTIRPGWETIAEATLSQFQLRDLLEQHLTISLPETRKTRFRLVLDNRDSPELLIDDIEASGPQYEVVFLEKPDQTVRLVYGSETAEPPEHDTVSLTTALAKGIRPMPATLGIPSELAVSPGIKPPDLKGLLNNPLALGAIVVFLVLILGWGLYQASSRVNQMPRGDAEQ